MLPINSFTKLITQSVPFHKIANKIGWSCFLLISAVFWSDNNRMSDWKRHQFFRPFFYFCWFYWSKVYDCIGKKLEVGGIYDFINNVLFSRLLVAEAINILPVKWHLQETKNFFECKRRIVGNSVDTVCWQSKPSKRRKKNMRMSWLHLKLSNSNHVSSAAYSLNLFGPFNCIPTKAKKKKIF